MQESGGLSKVEEKYLKKKTRRIGDCDQKAGYLNLRFQR